MTSFQDLRTKVDREIAAWVDALPDDGLYGPMAYLMRLPAKRVRPVATLMACEAFGGDPADALQEALGIELFHNFTLMHDDIMDQAPLRRGRPTVHMKWDVNTAILSGDAMLVKVYQWMARDPAIAVEFSRHALWVCEGQQLDMAFETRAQVGVEEYMEMIRLKTAVLLAGALRIGAVKAGASKQDVDHIGRFGEHLGIAFQLRDDLLDAFGDPDRMGKQSGGDLRAGKKTWLLIEGLARERRLGKSMLASQLALPATERDVPAMRRALSELGVPQAAEEVVARHEQAAIGALERCGAPRQRLDALAGLARSLMARQF